jgi:hypothetical protein
LRAGSSRPACDQADSNSSRQPANASGGAPEAIQPSPKRAARSNEAATPPPFGRRLRPHLLAAPDLPHPLQHLVEHLPPRLHADPGELVVVLAAAEPDPQGHPFAGERMQAQHLLGQGNRVAAQRPEQDRGREADPLGHRRRDSQRGQHLEVRIGDAVDRAETGEPTCLSPPRPLRQLVAAGARHCIGKTDRDVHLSSFQ